MTNTHWKNLIPQCFCHGEREFVGHPSEEEAAFELLSQLRAKQVGWSTFERELRLQLAAWPKLDSHKEVARVRERFGPWLLD